MPKSRAPKVPPKGKRPPKLSGSKNKAGEEEQSPSLVNHVIGLTSQLTSGAIGIAKSGKLNPLVFGDKWVKYAYAKTPDPRRLDAMADAGNILKDAREVAGINIADLAGAVGVIDPEVWAGLGWGLADPDQARILEVLMPDVADPAERRARALGLQRRVLTRARAFMNAMDRPATTPEGLDIYLVAGDALPTTARVSIDSTTGEPSVIGTAPGDRTVLRSSAVLDERVGRAWQPFVVTPLDLRTTMFLPEEHLALTRNAVFRDNVLYWLLEAPR